MVKAFLSQIWDTELGGLKSELVTNKALFSVAAGAGGLLLAAGAERSVRLYDPRAGTDVKAAYTAHTGWVTAVSWSQSTSVQFASSSHDQTVR
jgi:WD40 repeat protein